MLKAKCKMIGAGKWRKKAAEPIIKIIFRIISILNNVSKTMKKDPVF